MNLFIFITLLLSFGSVSFAAEPTTTGKNANDVSAKATDGANVPGTDSCGLGWRVTQHKTLLATATRGTTNAFVPPTFGMTSGTIGCDQHDFSGTDVPTAAFVVQNSDSLKLEMAQGKGEYLEALADSFGCDRGAMAQVLQNHYALVAGSNTSGITLFLNIKDLVLSEPALRCHI